MPRLTKAELAAQAKRDAKNKRARERRAEKKEQDEVNSIVEHLADMHSAAIEVISGLPDPLPGHHYVYDEGMGAYVLIPDNITTIYDRSYYDSLSTEDSSHERKSLWQRFCAWLKRCEG